jgi:transposase
MLGQHPKSEVAKHFLTEGHNKSTIYNMIARFYAGGPMANKKKPGRRSGLSATKRGKIKTAAKNKIGATTRKLAKKFNTSQSTVFRILKEEGMKHYKRASKPKYTEKQLQEIPGKCRKLRRKYLKPGVTIVMDDEKYFTFSNSSTAGNTGFYTDELDTTPDKVRYARKAKFEPKVLVWAAISTAGISNLYVQTCKAMAVNTEVYTKKCLPKMVVFVKKHHKVKNIVFWPDLASCHYAKATLDWLTANKIRFVRKTDNPPNVPQARPIESYWAILSQAVYENGWEATTAQQLKSRIIRCAKKVDLKVVQTMMERVPIILRKIEDEGPLSV